MAAGRVVTTFDSNVFINCPFDSGYVSLLRPLLFTVIYLGFTPRIASERSDSNESRLAKIVELIRSSRSRFDYQRALSDISGLDIKNHDNDPPKVVRAVRNWFVETIALRRVPAASTIWYSFTEFASAFYDARKTDGYSDEDLNMMPVPEYVEFIREWVADFRSRATGESRT